MLSAKWGRDKLKGKTNTQGNDDQTLKTMQLPHYIKSLQNIKKLRNSSLSDKER